MKNGYMKNSYIWIMSAAAIALSSATAAQADEPALSFALTPPNQGDSAVVPSAEAPNLDVPNLGVSGSGDAGAIAPSTPTDRLLVIPIKAAAPPIQPESLAKAELPPPPPLTDVAPVEEVEEAAAVVTFAPAEPLSTAPALAVQPQDSVEVTTEAAAVTTEPASTLLPSGGELQFLPAAIPAVPVPVPVAAVPPSPSGESRPVELSFALADLGNALGTALGNALSQLPGTAPLSPANQENTATDPIFEGGAESLVARTVGSAEGTRTAEGLRTPAYYGHKDPGNGVWNLGSFSYQHGAKSPEAADERQLARLQTQAATLQQKAAAKGLALTLEEHLNGIDLANQAPMAALDRGGYIDWLADAKKLGMTGAEAVLWARTRSFLNPDTQQWNAPGLGNNINSISRDQERRMQAIARALSSYQAQKPSTGSPDPLASLPGTQSPVTNQPATNEVTANNPIVNDSAIAPVSSPIDTAPLRDAEPAEQPLAKADSTPSFLAWFMP